MNTSITTSSSTGAGVDARQLCLALIWLKGPATAPERAHIRDSILTRPGVASIEASARSDAVMLVRFDRSSTCASAIVGWLRMSGLPALLVGC